MSHKGIIMIFLAGGPPHQDMFDMKPQAPREIRGEFSPIRTNVPGIEICELFPRMATMMDKFAIIRSLKGCVDRHEPHQCFSGEPAWLGPMHAPFRPDDGPGMRDMLPQQQIGIGRMSDRKQLLASVDRIRRQVDAYGERVGFATYTDQAFQVLTSSRLVDALDIEKGDPALRERYGKGSRDFVADGPWGLLDQFLIARRLIEAGVRCVTLAFSRWDWHGGNFASGRQDMPMLDQGVSALVEDIHQRGLDRDIAVVVWGEFGRTPKINKDAGRDHWPNANFALLAGGGMRTGQVIGATDKTASVPIERPVRPQVVLATLYQSIGIELDHTTVIDHTGRPQYLLQRRTPVHELL